MVVSRRTMAADVALLSLVSLVSTPAMAREDLAGKDLPVVNELDSGANSHLKDFLCGGTELDGSIESVTVTRDDARRLELRVRYTGFEGGKIWAHALDENDRKQMQIHSAPMVLNRSAREATLTLEMDPNWDWDGLSSAYVSVNVGLPHRSTPSIIRTYVLRKAWDAPTK